MKRHSLFFLCTAALVARPSFAVEIPIDVPLRGYVSLQIRNEAGEVVGHAVSPKPLEPGRRSVEWNLSGPDDGVRQGAGA